MSTLMAEMNAKAHELGISLSAHVDLTYRCNERCIHCYLPHDDRGELYVTSLSTGRLFQVTA